MNVRILVLGILMHRVAHGYEIQQYLHFTGSEHWAAVLPGSTYHALKKMKEEGLVEVARTEWEGKRAREVYAITEAGKAAFYQLLEEIWQMSPQPSPSPLYVAVNFMASLPRDRLEVLVARQRQKFERGLLAMDQMDSHIPENVPEHMECIFVNVRDHLQADLKMLHALEARLERGEVTPMPLPALEELMERHARMEKHMQQARLLPEDLANLADLANLKGETVNHTVNHTVDHET